MMGALRPDRLRLALPAEDVLGLTCEHLRACGFEVPDLSLPGLHLVRDPLGHGAAARPSDGARGERRLVRFAAGKILVRDRLSLNAVLGGDAEPRKALEVFKRAFQPGRVVVGEHKRGVL